MKKIVVTLSIGLLLVTPFFASALTREEILDEIGRLIKIVDAIKGQLRKLGVDIDNPDVGVPNNPLPTVTQGCINWYRTMTLGTTGTDVTQLQTFLGRQGMLDAAPTGYFGTATRGAVYRWQIAASMNGTATVDRDTADTMNAYCSTGKSPSPSTSTGTGTNVGTGTNTRLPVAPIDRYSFTVEPRSGAAPHQVSAFFVISGTTCTAYSLDWGDNTAPVTREGSYTNCDPDSINRQLSHTYLSKGSYNVTFRTIRGSLSNAPVVSQTTVTVQ
jgi:peptidoglycan hydrolase-like protein with peptidoglycan-binding domain